MSLTGAIETANSVISFATTVADLAREDRGDRARFRRAVEALRQIYFTPRGTLNVLGALAEGERPDEELVRQVLIDFNDAEWRVARALEFMDFDNLESLDLSLRQRRLMTEIAYGKRNLRRDIQNALNEPLTRRKRVDQNNARVLLLRVQSLNAMIESLEEEIL